MDKLRVNGLEVWMKLGCTPEERAFPQRIELDVEMETTLRDAARKDDMRLTVDYAELSGRLRRTLEARSYKLAEAAAEEAARWVLKNFRVRRVTVRLRKRVLPGIDHFEVEVQRP
jgi:7,8-dihydroneopterin aldolase/epimerase/oxygenase